MKLHNGQHIRVKFPFYTGAQEEGDVTSECCSDDVWIPGCKSEPTASGDHEFVAEGIGEMILKVVDMHRPGRYQERVFYTRRWVDPDGNEFNAGKLHVTTIGTFKRRAAGYYHAYRVL